MEAPLEECLAAGAVLLMVFLGGLSPFCHLFH